MWPCIVVINYQNIVNIDTTYKCIHMKTVLYLYVSEGGLISFPNKTKNNIFTYLFYIQ